MWLGSSHLIFILEIVIFCINYRDIPDTVLPGGVVS
jgi:hypothetical protein